jgi:hypothetical protein
MDNESKVPPDEPSTVFGLLALAMAGVDLVAMLLPSALRIPALRLSPLRDRFNDFLFDYGGIFVVVGLIFALTAIGFGGCGRRMGYWAMGMLFVSVVLLFV